MVLEIGFEPPRVFGRKISAYLRPRMTPDAAPIGSSQAALCRSSIIDSTLARAPFAGRRIDAVARLLRLSDSRVSGAIARGALDFDRQLGGFQLAHGHHFLDTMPTASMSLCITDCGPRLSHFKVNPDQLDSVTVAWSFLSLRQQTREPTPNSLDSEPVIRLTAFVRVGPAR